VLFGQRYTDWSGHSLKASGPIEVSSPPNSSSVKFMQPAKALAPIVSAAHK
jgi:hypothetical protein